MRKLKGLKVPAREALRDIDSIEVAVLESAESSLEWCVYDARQRGLSERELRRLANALVCGALRRALRRAMRLLNPSRVRALRKTRGKR